MTKIHTDSIRKGRIALEDVPAMFRRHVTNLLQNSPETRPLCPVITW